MAALPVEILFGLYLGLLTGMFPAIVAWALGFIFRYFTGVTVPGFAVVVLGVAIAGVNGGFLGLLDGAIRNSPRLVTAILVVLMMTLYAHSQGDRMGASFPRRLSLRTLRERTLSADVVELVGARGRVTVEVAGEVADVEGYPPLPAELRDRIRESTWELPADLPLSAMEARVAEQLRAAHDLAEVSVTVDDRATATVAAAPPSGALSRRLAPGEVAVSVDALVPTGMARGDVATLRTPSFSVEGTVVSARSDGGTTPATSAGPEVAPDGGEPEGGEPEAPAEPEPLPAAPTTDGGEGRVTVAVDRADAERLLAVERARLLVRSRGSRGEYELVSLLRQAGVRFRKLTVREGGPLDGTTIGAASVRDAYGVTILGLRGGAVEADGDRRWRFAPRGDAGVSAGDELFAAGAPAALEAFREVAT